MRLLLCCYRPYTVGACGAAASSTFSCEGSLRFWFELAFRCVHFCGTFQNAEHAEVRVVCHCRAAATGMQRQGSVSDAPCDEMHTFRI